MKRWYQLSMLQVLVATAVIAFFVAKNIEVKSTSESAPRFYDMRYSGWPYIHYTAVYNVQASPPILKAEDRRWKALAANLACCLGACTALVALSTIFKRRSRVDARA